MNALVCVWYPLVHVLVFDPYYLKCVQKSLTAFTLRKTNAWEKSVYFHTNKRSRTVRAFSELHTCHLSSINLIMSISLFCIRVSFICLVSTWTHLSSTPVWRRGRSWPHRVGPLPRWGTKPAPRSQSSSGGQTQNTIQSSHGSSMHKSKQAGGLFFITIKSLFMRENAMSTQTCIQVHPGSFIPVHHNLLLLATEAPLERWRSSVSPRGNLTAVTEKRDILFPLALSASGPEIPKSEANVGDTPLRNLTCDLRGVSADRSHCRHEFWTLYIFNVRENTTTERCYRVKVLPRFAYKYNI